MPVYGKPYSSEMLVTDRTPKEYVRMFEDKERPTPEHVCSPDGLWILPEPSIESVRAARKARYSAETDELKDDIGKDILLGEDVTEKQAGFQRRVAIIKADLPLPEPKQVQSHYKAL